MEWTDIRLTVAKADAENAEAVATLIAEGGIYIEDYSDIEQQVAEIAHVDLIEQELLDKPRDTVIIHMYLEPGASPVETLALIQARMEAAGIAYTVETEGVEQEDWQNGWRKYYHPMDIGKRLAIVPSWQEYDTDRVKLILDPGLAFGTGGHETTSLCLEALDERVRGGERVLDIGTGSGILAIAALKLGAGSAEGVDIDPVAVRTAGENAALNGVADKLTVLVGDLSDKASGQYNIITANIVAAAILSLAPHVPVLMAPGARFIASGIIDERKDEVLAGLKAGFVGDGYNMANSVIVGCLAVGMTVTIACPKGYRPAADVLMLAKQYGDKFTLTNDPDEAARDADVLFTDVWVSMGMEREAEQRRRDFTGFTLDAARMALAKPDCMVQHPLPAHRGEEIAPDVLEAHADEIFDEAENRIYVEKAVLAVLLAGK